MSLTGGYFVLYNIYRTKLPNIYRKYDNKWIYLGMRRAKMFDTDIKKLYGVGEVRASKYRNMGIYTVGDLLLHYPRGYEDRGNIINITDGDGVQKSAYLLTVATQPRNVRIKGRMSLTKFRAYDDSATCEITFFNQEYLKNTFIPGNTYRFYGRIERKNGVYSMTSPAYEPWSEEAPPPSLVSVYPLTEGISQKQMAKDMRSALVLFETRECDDSLPEEIRKKYGLCLHSYAVRNIHMPESFSALAAAKKRLIFDEFFEFALGITMAGLQNKRAAALPCKSADEYELLSRLPFDPTGAQRRVIEEIKLDMAKDSAMSRMVIGDVGSGKTVCAAAAMLFSVQSGHQAALMAPTEILARQHFASLCEMFEGTDIKIALLLGATTAAEKRRIYAALAGEVERIDIVVGTQALLSEGVEFSSLALLVVDEQHRFGVRQRAALLEKNKLCHMLVMSATPIPRSLALALYGDLDISYIDEMPKGRQRVDTFVVDESYRERLNKFIYKQVADGGQVYVVCPSIEESEESRAILDDEQADLLMSSIGVGGDLLDFSEQKEKLPLKSAVQFAKTLADALPGLHIDFLHGKLNSREKDEKMRLFAEGEIDVLVSTTVIEVGVNVPAASLMIVENAERFGLSQLHQLRGRVGRGSRKSYCVLVSESINTESTAKERLNILKSSYDGYSIAEKDLAMRGPGDFLRSSEGRMRQSGGVHFKLAELCDDTGLMRAAFDEAKALLATDPELASHRELRQSVLHNFLPNDGYVN